MGRSLQGKYYCCCTDSCGTGEQEVEYRVVGKTRQHFHEHLEIVHGIKIKRGQLMAYRTDLVRCIHCYLLVSKKFPGPHAQICPGLHAWLKVN